MRHACLAKRAARRVVACATGLYTVRGESVLRFPCCSLPPRPGVLCGDAEVWVRQMSARGCSVASRGTCSRTHSVLGGAGGRGVPSGVETALVPSDRALASCCCMERALREAAPLPRTVAGPGRGGFLSGLEVYEELGQGACSVLDGDAFWRRRG